MKKLSKSARSASLITAVTGAAIVAAAGIANAEPVKPNCQWHENAYGQYPLHYPQDCKLKEYDSKPTPADHTGPYTS